MARAADFSPETKIALEKRAGSQCSFPGCGKLTSGPSAESETSISNTGMACHIYSANSGPSARRIPPKEMTLDELKDISNGIWMCYSHGKLIDTDERSYTVKTLKGWRRVAEKRARLLQALDASMVSMRLQEEKLADSSVDLCAKDIEEMSQDFVERSCVSELWGLEAALEIRTFIIEIARNALSHGGSENVKLKSKGHSIKVISEGGEFSLDDLGESPNGRGGAMALQELRSRHANLLISHKWDGAKNLVTISFSGGLPNALHEHPCSFPIGRHHKENLLQVLESSDQKSCDKLYAFPEKHQMAYSDVFFWSSELEKLASSRPGVHLVIRKQSEGVMDFLEMSMPSVKIILI